MGNFFSRNFDPATDLVDLKGRVAIVTGGNAGIGYWTVQHLSRAGAKVYLAARNEGRATAALAKLKEEGLEAHWLKLDLSDPRDAKKAAEDFMQREKRLDLLVNNAAVTRSKYVIGPDGVSMMAIVNHISPVVFTQTLLPLMKDTAKEADSDVRIVNLSSIAHKLVPSSVKFDDVQDFNVKFSFTPMPGFLRYAHSKFMNVLWTKALQRRLNEDPVSPITALSVHPGGVDTFSMNWPLGRFFGWLIGFVITHPSIGAYGSVFAAAGKRVKESPELYQGVYMESQPTGKIVQPHKGVLSEALGDSLWNTTEAFLRSIGV